jgi:hypothetical protein
MHIYRHLIVKPIETAAAITLTPDTVVSLTVNYATGETAFFRLGRLWAEDNDAGVNSPIVADTYRLSTGEWDLARFTPGQRVIVCSETEIDLSGGAVIVAEAVHSPERRW